MDVLSLISLVSGVCIGILSGGATFFNKQRFEAQITLLQAGNDELRKQNLDLRNERGDLGTQITKYQEQANEREKTISYLQNQPNLEEVITILNNNHREVMTVLTKKGA